MLDLGRISPFVPALSEQTREKLVMPDHRSKPSRRQSPTKLTFLASD